VTGQQDRRVWLGAGVLGTVVIVAAAWLLVIGPQRSAVETLRSDTEAVELSNATLTTKTATLRQQAEGRDELTASLRGALAQLPSEDDLPEFSRQLARQAKERDVSVTGIVVGSATAPGTATDAAAAGAGTGAVAPTVRAIPVTVVSTGPALQQLYFLRDIQQVGPRRALVTSTSIVPLGEAGIDTASTMTVQLTVFSAPLSDVTQAQLADVLGADSN
jgi:hypothetical protein